MPSSRCRCRRRLSLAHHRGRPPHLQHGLSGGDLGQGVRAGHGTQSRRSTHGAEQHHPERSTLWRCLCFAKPRHAGFLARQAASGAPGRPLRGSDEYHRKPVKARQRAAMAVLRHVYSKGCASPRPLGGLQWGTARSPPSVVQYGHREVALLDLGMPAGFATGTTTAANIAWRAAQVGDLVTVPPAPHWSPWQSACW